MAAVYTGAYDSVRGSVLLLKGKNTLNSKRWSCELVRLDIASNHDFNLYGHHMTSPSSHSGRVPTGYFSTLFRIHVAPHLLSAREWYPSVALRHQSLPGLIL